MGGVMGNQVCSGGHGEVLQKGEVRRMVEVLIDSRDGCLAEEDTPEEFRQKTWFPSGSEPSRSCEP